MCSVSLFYDIFHLHVVILPNFKIIEIIKSDALKAYSVCDFISLPPHVHLYWHTKLAVKATKRSFPFCSLNWTTQLYVLKWYMQPPAKKQWYGMIGSCVSGQSFVAGLSVVKTFRDLHVMLSPIEVLRKQFLLLNLHLLRGSMSFLRNLSEKLAVFRRAVSAYIGYRLRFKYTLSNSFEVCICIHELSLCCSPSPINANFPSPH